MIVYKEELHTRIKLNTSYRVKYALFNEYVDCKGGTFNKFCLFFISKKIRGPPFWFEFANKYKFKSEESKWKKKENTT